MARLADRLGYARYWLAEHHNIPSVASTAPEIMIAHVAMVTSRIRVGSGGIMLPNHAPLRIAESFRVLEALHPGRIDLGIGRAPGSDSITALALRRSREKLGADDFPEQLEELISLPRPPGMEDATRAPGNRNCAGLRGGAGRTRTDNHAVIRIAVDRSNWALCQLSRKNTRNTLSSTGH